uniref:Uncharacterized protein n=1 Tax=Neisseria meningitidis TaxID=487 RepID=Q9JPE6_NEIME|nr:hypothetical protein [Neisseria meningitidis]
MCAPARMRSMIYGSMPSEKLTIFQTAFVMQVNIQIPCMLYRRGSVKPPLFEAPRLLPSFTDPVVPKLSAPGGYIVDIPKGNLKTEIEKAGQTARIRLPETASDGQERRLETGAAGLRQMGLLTGRLDRSRCNDSGDYCNRSNLWIRSGCSG